MTGDVEERRSSGLRLVEGLVLVGAGVIAVVVAFWVLGAIAGFLWGVVKVVAIIVLIGGVLWWLLARKRS